MILDREALGAMLLQAAKLLEENTQYLSDIDSRFGDGDHGITMGKIAKLIQERVPQWGEDSIKDFLDSLGMAIMEVKGGSAGPLYGTMIGGLGVNLDDDAGQVDEAGLKAMFAGCLSEMEDITTAKVGDKTMMDALIPAVQAAQQTQGDCKAIWEAAANRDIIHRGEENMIINNALEGADRVTIVTQGGSGHEPAISGFVGEGMVGISPWWAISLPLPVPRPVWTPSSWPTRARACCTSFSTTPAICSPAA